jgi:hypothetical protein
VLFLPDPDGFSRPLRRKTLDALADLNRLQQKQSGDPETPARISQYELAYRMQTSAPEAMDISKEPARVPDLYGSQPGQVSFANNCLLARTTVRRGGRTSVTTCRSPSPR